MSCIKMLLFFIFSAEPQMHFWRQSRMYKSNCGKAATKKWLHKTLWLNSDLQHINSHLFNLQATRADEVFPIPGLPLKSAALFSGFLPLFHSCKNPFSCLIKFGLPTKSFSFWGLYFSVHKVAVELFVSWGGQKILRIFREFSWNFMYDLESNQFFTFLTSDFLSVSIGAATIGWGAFAAIALAYF